MGIYTMHGDPNGVTYDQCVVCIRYDQLYVVCIPTSPTISALCAYDTISCTLCAYRRHLRSVRCVHTIRSVVRCVHTDVTYDQCVVCIRYDQLYVVCIPTSPT